MKNNLHILILLLIPLISFGQDVKSGNSPLYAGEQDLEYGNSTEAAELCVSIRSNSASSDSSADESLEAILSVVGAAKRFMLYPCDKINNAVAYTSPTSGFRYILYDEEFMNSLSNRNNKYWANMAVLAHEVGHHINGHTLSEKISQYDNRLQELEADEFAGFVLSKLGADLKEVEDIFSNLGEDGDDTYRSHPNKTRRLNAINKGFEKARLNGNITQKKLSSDEEYYYRGEENYDNEEYDKAIEDFSQALNIKKTDLYYAFRGRAKEALEDYPGALSDYYRSLELDPEYSWSLFRYGYVEYLKNTKESLYSSISYFKKWIELDNSDESDKPFVYAYLGQSFKDLEIYDKALEYLNKAEKISTETNNTSLSSNIYRDFGLVYQNIDSLDLAEINFVKSVKLDSLNSAKNSYLADFYRDSFGDDRDEKPYKPLAITLFPEKVKEGIKYYDKSISLDPDYVYPNFGRSIAYALLRNEDESYLYQALEDITKAIELNSKKGQYYYYRGHYRNLLGDNQGACKDWLQAIDLEYDYDVNRNSLVEYCGYNIEDFYNNSDFYNLGNDLYNKGKYEEAIPYFDKSILLPGVDFNDYSRRAYSFYYLERYEEAIPDFQKANEDTPGYYYRFYIAYSLYKLNRIEDSKEAFYKELDELLLSELYTDENNTDYDIDYINKRANFINDVFDLRIKLLIGEEKIDEAIKMNQLLYDAFKYAFDENEDSELNTYLASTLREKANLFNLYKEDYLRSIISMNEAVKFELENYENYRIRGDYKIKLNNVNGACKDYNTALSLVLDDKNLEKEIKLVISKNCK